MSCRRARHAIRLRRDEELSIELEFVLDAHLQACDACREFERSAEKLDELLAGLPEPPVERLDVEHSVAKIRAARRDDGAEKQITSSRTALWRVAAALVFVVGALTLLLRELGDEQDGGADTPHVASEDSTMGGSTPHDETPAIAESEEPAGPGPVIGEDSPLDPERLARAREEVRQCIVASAQGLGQAATRETALAFAEFFEVSTSELKREGWPLRRLVERQLEGSDIEAASAAARYLGVRGDGTSRRRLTAALDHADRSVARAATLALRDSAEEGLAGLDTALEHPDLRALALRGMSALGGAATAELLGRRFAHEMDEGAPASASDDLLAALEDLGLDAMSTWIELGEEGVLTNAELAQILAGIEGAPLWLDDALEGDGRTTPGETLVCCAVDLIPEAAADWILEQVEDGRRIDLARAQAPRLAGTLGVQTLLRLQDSRLSSEEFQELVIDTLELDALRFAQYVAGGERLTSLTEILIASDHPRATPALAQLMKSTDLTDELISAAVLAVGAHGGPDEATLLAELFSTLALDDRHLAATCLIALHQLGGEELCAKALADAPPRLTSNILSQLRRRRAGSRTNPSMYRLARELKSFLSERDRKNWSSSS